MAVQERTILHVIIQCDIIANELMEVLDGKISELLLQFVLMLVIPAHGLSYFNNILCHNLNKVSFSEAHRHFTGKVTSLYPQHENIGYKYKK
jgi:hypothetical protein